MSREGETDGLLSRRNVWKEDVATTATGNLCRLHRCLGVEVEEED
jgi:hypothetical protein